MNEQINQEKMKQPLVELKVSEVDKLVVDKLNEHTENLYLTYERIKSLDLSQSENVEFVRNVVAELLTFHNLQNYVNSSLQTIIDEFCFITNDKPSESVTEGE